MNCYDAFNEILEDFKDLLEKRETSIRRVEEALSQNLIEESNAIRRLEQQIRVLRLELQNHSALPTTGFTPYMCSNCSKALVHDHFSDEIITHLLKSHDRAKSPKSRDQMDAVARERSPSYRRRNPYDSTRKDDFVQESPSSSSNTQIDSGQYENRQNFCLPAESTHFKPSFSKTIEKSSESPFQSLQKGHGINEIETRMQFLSDKVDEVKSKASWMVNRSANLNDNFQILRDQTIALQYGINNINQNLN